MNTVDYTPAEQYQLLINGSEYHNEVIQQLEWEHIDAREAARRVAEHWIKVYNQVTGDYTKYKKEDVDHQGLDSVLLPPEVGRVMVNGKKYKSLKHYFRHLGYVTAPYTAEEFAEKFFFMIDDRVYSEDFVCVCSRIFKTPDDAVRELGIIVPEGQRPKEAIRHQFKQKGVRSYFEW